MSLNWFLSFHSTQLDAARFCQAARSPYSMVCHFRLSVRYKTLLTVCADQLSIRSLLIPPLLGDTAARWRLLDGGCSMGASPDAQWQMPNGRWPCFLMAASQWPRRFSMVFLHGRFSIAAARGYRCSMTSLFDSCSSMASLNGRFLRVLRPDAQCLMTDWPLLNGRC